MKNFKTIVLSLALCAIALAGAQAEGNGRKEDGGAEKGIVFTSGTFAQILKKAKAENKIIFFDAYTTWCGPCKLLQKNVFTRTDVADVFNKNFINIKVDMERGEGPRLAEKYPLQGYPTLFFIDGNGKVVKELLGLQTPEALINAGKAVAKKNGAVL